MSDLHTALDDYLVVRRSLGYQLDKAEELLTGFVRYLDDEGATHITTELALAWATLPAGAHPAWWRHRLGAVRGFARHLQSVEPRTEVPPADLLPAAQPRMTPYLYSETDIAGLMAAAHNLAPALRGATYEALIGLLVVSGLRIGEAIRLDRDDIDEDRLALVVRRSKPCCSREVPLHATTVEVLHAYARQRDHEFPVPRSQSLFISERGTRLCYTTVRTTFRGLIGTAGLEGRGTRCRPRLHDIRHSFAVASVLSWYREGADVDAKLPLLSAVLGHVDPASTYWYLETAPELMAVVADRLGALLGERS